MRLCRTVARVALVVGLVLAGAKASSATPINLTVNFGNAHFTALANNIGGSYDTLDVYGLSDVTLTLDSTSPVTVAVADYVLGIGGSSNGKDYAGDYELALGVSGDVTGTVRQAFRAISSDTRYSGEPDRLEFYSGTPSDLLVDGHTVRITLLSTSYNGYSWGANPPQELRASFALVPEPTTLSLLGLGLVGMARAVRRRR